MLRIFFRTNLKFKYGCCKDVQGPSSGVEFASVCTPVRSSHGVKNFKTKTLPVKSVGDLVVSRLPPVSLNRNTYPITNPPKSDKNPPSPRLRILFVRVCLEVVCGDCG